MIEQVDVLLPELEINDVAILPGNAREISERVAAKREQVRSGQGRTRSGRALNRGRAHPVCSRAGVSFLNRPQPLSFRAQRRTSIALPSWQGKVLRCAQDDAENRAVST